MRSDAEVNINKVKNALSKDRRQYSNKEICKETKLGRDTVRKYLDILTKQGVVIIINALLHN